MGKIGKKLSIQSIKDAFRSSKKPHDTEKVVEEEAADPPSRSQHTPKHYHYTATEITEQKLQQYFGIIPRDGPFLFQPLDTVELVDIPGDLLSMITRVRRTLGYIPVGDYSEAMARTIIDLIIITAIDEIRARIASYPNEITKLKYEIPLRCKVTALDGMHEVSGKADYCVGHSDAKQGEANLAIIEAKCPQEYSSARRQLIAYMTTVVHLRRQNRKGDAGVYGINSDGVTFTFYHMTAGGVYSRSRDFNWESHPRQVFAYISYVIKAAIQLSPSTTAEPLTPGEYYQRHLGIEPFNK